MITRQRERLIWFLTASITVGAAWFSAFTVVRASSEETPDQTDGQTEPRTLESLRIPGIKRVVRIDDRLLVGSEPSEGSISHLHDQGVSVLLSVDARRPHVDEAKRLGLRVVHLPIGYDSVPEERIEALQQLLREEPGPIYVHCHQGLHRGPAVAAILWLLATEGAPDRGTGILERCGTDPGYRGLWESVRSFRAPREPTTVPSLPEYVPADGLSEVMLRIDDACDRIADAGDPDSTTDLEHECLLLEQLFTELRRPDLHPGVDERSMPEAHLREALEAVRALKGGYSDHGFERLENSCTSCHSAARR
ncbi:MAG: hypothetical protein VX641_05745 [Planctomycetota bacterium]|nr:hypothetical protein [Planctomycetota bacterium]